jgi:hypothetical protein
MLQLVAAMHSTVDDHVWQATMILSNAGFRSVENESIPVWNMTIEFSDRMEKYLITTNQAIIKLMSVIRPGDDVNQTNQRLRRKWQSQRMFRVSAQDARVLSASFMDMAYMKFRAGLVLIEWPNSDEVIGCLTADKQVRPRRAPALIGKSKGQLGADVKRLERENEQLRAQVAVLQRVVDSLTLAVRPVMAPAAPVYAFSYPDLQRARLVSPVQQQQQQQQQPHAAVSAADSAAALALANLHSTSPGQTPSAAMAAPPPPPPQPSQTLGRRMAVDAAAAQGYAGRMTLPGVASLMEPVDAPQPGAAAAAAAAESASRLAMIDLRRMRASPQ